MNDLSTPLHTETWADIVYKHIKPILDSAGWEGERQQGEDWLLVISNHSETIEMQPKLFGLTEAKITTSTRLLTLSTARPEDTATEALYTTMADHAQRLREQAALLTTFASVWSGE